VWESSSHHQHLVSQSTISSISVSPSHLPSPTSLEWIDHPLKLKQLSSHHLTKWDGWWDEMVDETDDEKMGEIRDGWWWLMMVWEMIDDKMKNEMVDEMIVEMVSCEKIWSTISSSTILQLAMIISSWDSIEEMMVEPSLWLWDKN